MTAEENTPAPEAEVETDTEEGKRLTPAQWEEIQNLYELGTVTLSDLHDQYGISRQALHRGLKRRGAIFGSRKHEVGQRIAAEAVKAAAAAGAEFAAKRQAAIDQAKMNYLKSNNFIMAQTMSLLNDAKANARAYSTLNADLNALGIAAKILGQTRKETYTILDVDANVDENTLPKLFVEDLTADEIAQMQAADVDDELDIPETVDREAEPVEVVIEEEDGGGG